MVCHTLCRLFLLACFTLASAGCGGSSVIGAVSYEGATLVVSGVRYERPTGIYKCGANLYTSEAICDRSSPRPRYDIGSILVQMYTADESVVLDKLNEFGLRTINRSGLRAVGSLPGVTSLTIEVPELFEMQWSEALRNTPPITGAWTNNFFYLDPLQVTTDSPSR